jgi:hypothetical protein
MDEKVSGAIARGMDNVECLSMLLDFAADGGGRI